MNKKNTTIMLLIIILIGVLIGGSIFLLNNESNEEPIKSLMHYPYEEITLVLSKDWMISDTKPQALTFQRDTNKLKIPSLIDNLTIYTYKSLRIHDLNVMTNSYSIYLKTIGYKIISMNFPDKEFALKRASWIKYSKNNVISEIFFVEKNNIIYSITSTYPEDNDTSSDDMNYNLYEIVKLIY